MDNVAVQRANPPKRLLWVDLLKAVALIWIFLNHLVERLFGAPYIANPFAGWPPFQERLAQLSPLTGHGFWDIPINLLRYIGWSGDQGVQLFLVTSGFGLAWGLLHSRGTQPLELKRFYIRRLERIYPQWWGAHAIFLALWLITGIGLSAANPATYLSILGIRVTPNLLYYFSPAWWYIGLIIQLYLVFPILWQALNRIGPLRLLIATGVVAFPIRAAGLFFFTGYLDAWQRGAIFITRLPEFVFGICLAAWLFQDFEATTRRLRSLRTLAMAVGLYALGTVLSLTLFGMTFAPFLLAVGSFVILYAVLGAISNAANRLVKPGLWTGEHSYSLYLMHHPMILFLIPAGAASAPRVLAGTAAAIVLTWLGAVALEWSTGFVQATISKLRGRFGLLKTSLGAAAIVAMLAGLLLASELLIRRFDPQEILGWGERPSLEADPRFGWRLKPNQVTRLRWQSYDYVVEANSLGFPGPEFSEQKTAGTYRVMVVGDAFTSAEGVNTNQAWPRLLENILREQRPDRPIEVLNFAITGYGPNQYQAVIEAYAPVYHPDLILIGFFVNDYQDVLWSNADFQQSIGFNLPGQDSLYAIIRLEDLHELIRVQVLDPVKEFLRGTPSSLGYFLGNFAALEIDRQDIQAAGAQMVFERLAQIKKIAADNGAKVAIAMIPAPVQVCQPKDLAYYPRNVDLTDASRYDLDLPQRETEAISNQLGYAYFDLRPALEAAEGGCPYQSRNMHWTVAGHQIVASYVAGVLLRDGYIP